MEFHQLRYFCAIARTGTFTRAAESENVAQPSLSQQILKLEEELGARLFERLPRIARLTPYGEFLLPRALKILKEVGEARAEIQAMSAMALSHAQQQTSTAAKLKVLNNGGADPELQVPTNGNCSRLSPPGKSA